MYNSSEKIGKEKLTERVGERERERESDVDKQLLDTKGCCRRWRCMWSEETARQKNIELHLFDIKGIKSMASDVINYKYHIKTMSLW